MRPVTVFITEDESIVREGLRDMIPWSEYGFAFAGEASDGEMALPMVRKIRPDILITDIRMPFMDGLVFSRLVSRELPKTRIIILSGYDDFEYARQAIELHVDQYLLKPITKANMIKALEETRKRIEEEQEQEEYLQQFVRESKEYEHYARRVFFEKMVSGGLSISEIYEQAAKLEIELDAECSTRVLFSLQTAGESNAYSEQSSALQDRLLEKLYQDPDFLVFRGGVLNYAVLIKASADSVESQSERCVEIIRSYCEQTEEKTIWYAAVGTPTARLSGLPQSYRAAGHAMAYRHLIPGQHIFRAGEVADYAAEQGSMDAVDEETADPMLIRNFIHKGSEDEIDDFVEEYFASLGSAADSLMFRQYLLLSARINALAAAKEMDLDRAQLAARLPAPEMEESANLRKYLSDVLRTAIAFRDEEAKKQGSQLVESALAYIDAHYTDENISLNSVAKAINISTNYLSAVFSQTMGLSFVEYLTQKRMTRAKQLLRQSRKRTSEIAAETGYKDPHYFSFVFKKTQGCTPREFRSSDSV